jgi:hypothetical protein
MAYAEGTQVPVGKTKGEIETMLKAAGATNFYMGETDTTDVVGCKLSGRFVRFTVERPTKEWVDALRRKSRNPHRFNALNETEAEHRRRWRCLGLLIKAKLAAVDGKIRTMEQEFLADTMMPDQRTVYEHVTSAIAEAYQTGQVKPLLLGPSE